jgi:hypothetical protein
VATASENSLRRLERASVGRPGGTVINGIGRLTDAATERLGAAMVMLGLMPTDTPGRPATAVAGATDTEGKPKDAETPTETSGRSTGGNPKLGTGNLTVTPGNVTGAPKARLAEPAGSVAAGKEADVNESEGNPRDAEAPTDTLGGDSDALKGTPKSRAELDGAVPGGEEAAGNGAEGSPSDAEAPTDITGTDADAPEIPGRSADIAAPDTEGTEAETRGTPNPTETPGKDKEAPTETAGPASDATEAETDGSPDPTKAPDKEA